MDLARSPRRGAYAVKKQGVYEVEAPGPLARVAALGCCLENHRTAVRNVRRDLKEAIEHLEKEKKVSEDERKRAIDELDKITHSETKKIEELSAAKEREIMEIK